MSGGYEVIYGRNAVRESLRAGRRNFRLLRIAEGLAHDERIDEIASLASDAGLDLRHVPRGELEDELDVNHQGVALTVSSYPYESASDLEVDTSTIVLALDQLEDPRNVGTLLRTAEAVGCSLVVLPEHRAASITPAVVNASAGAVEHLRIAQETNLVQWLRRASDSGLWIVGLDQGSESLFETDVPLPCVVVVGSEGSGLRRLVRQHCDLLVSIPMHGRIESLNAAVAGSVALYEIREFAGLAL